MNPYQILGIPINATEEEIKNAYRKLAKQNHPDLHSDTERENYNAKMKQINEAYSTVLKNHSKEIEDTDFYGDNKATNFDDDYFYYQEKWQSESEDFEETYHLNSTESYIFDIIMSNAKTINSILSQLNQLIVKETSYHNKLIAIIREYLQEYYGKVKDYLKYYHRTDRLTPVDYGKLRRFISSIWKDNKSNALTWLNVFTNALEEEIFPALKFAEEYQAFIKESEDMRSKIELDFLGTTDVLKFLEENIIVFISRSQMLYDTNPMYESCDIKDENSKYLAGDFYRKGVAEIEESDMADDFTKEESAKSDDESKLKLKKKSKN